MLQEEQINASSYGDPAIVSYNYLTVLREVSTDTSNYRDRAHHLLILKLCPLPAVRSINNSVFQCQILIVSAP